MLVQSYYNRNRARVPLQDRVELQKATDAAAAGIEVEVLTAGIYNGPSHKALPRAEVGDLIRVAGGPYLEGLVASGRLRLPGQADEEPVAPVLTFGTATSNTGDLSPLFEAEAPASGHAFLLAAGLTERQAKLIFEAGFTSKLAIQQSVAAAGLEGLVAIKGIGQQTAQQVADWANEEGE
ncbi:MAG: hypothetical protein IPK79_00740 [Vampirovibrionales bacterium]|nr:hypothetical protein [Vampirovibrionales bacterium]